MTSALTYEPEECPNCGQRTMRGTVCQSCGMDITPPPPDTRLSKYSQSTSCKHKHWNPRDAKNIAISELTFAKYGVGWPEWRAALRAVARILGVDLRADHAPTVDDTDDIEAQIVDALHVEHASPEYCRVTSIFMAIAAMPEPKRTAVTMWAQSESHRDIAAACGWDEDYSRHAISRALDEIRELVAQ